MDFAKLTILSVLFSLCSTVQAFDFTSGIYVNHEKWLQYSRALSGSLDSQQILSSNDPIHFLKANAPPTSPDGASSLNAEDGETPMSLLSLNITDVEIPFKIVKDVLRLNAQDEGKIKFVTEKAVLFSFVNKTALRNIKESSNTKPNEDAMIIALFLPVEFRLSESEGKPLSGSPKTPTIATAEGKDSEWPTFFKSLLTEMAAANVTSQNLMDALLNSRLDGTQTPANASDPDSDEASYNEAMRLIKEYNFQDTDVMLYFFKTPHIEIPPKYVKQILEEVDISLNSSSQLKFEVNEVYLLTVANETAGKELKAKLQSGKWHGSQAPKSTPMVLSFIIPVEFNSERRGRSSLPRAKLANSPPQMFVDSQSIINDPTFNRRTPLNIVPVFSPAPSHLLSIVPVPLLMPYQNAERSQQYFRNLNGNEKDHLIRYLANGVHMQGNYDIMDKVESHGITPRENGKPVSAHAGPPDQQQAPPATAPGGITSALQP